MPQKENPGSQHDQGSRHQSSSRQTESGREATWTDMARASVGVLRVNQDPRPATDSRLAAMNHIDGVLRAAGAVDQPTVGSGVMHSIGGIRTVAGENGARDVHSVFQDPSLAQYYTIPANDPRAPAAHRAIAERELGYWQEEHRRNPSAGSAAAVGVNVETRAAIQSAVASTAHWADRFQRHGQSMGDQFGGMDFTQGGYSADAARRSSPTSGNYSASTRPGGASSSYYGQAGVNRNSGQRPGR